MTYYIPLVVIALTLMLIVCGLAHIGSHLRRIADCVDRVLSMHERLERESAADDDCADDGEEWKQGYSREED